MREKGVSPFDEFSSSERKRIKEGLDIWRDMLDHRDHNVQQRGAYEVQRDANLREPIQIFHHFYDLSGKYFEEMWFFSAIDKDKNLLGMRRTYIEDSDSPIFASGNIEVFTRGQGIAGAIEALNAQKLQQAINGKGNNELRYEIDDANLCRINMQQLEINIAKESNNHDAVRELESDLEQMTDERQAWLRLYGDSGKLGFKEQGIFGNLIKTFLPGQTDQVPGYSIVPVQGNLDLVAAIDNSIGELREIENRTQ